MSTHGREMRAFLVVCLSLSLCGGPVWAAQPIQQAAVTPRQPATVGRLLPRPVGISQSAGQTPAVPRMMALHAHPDEHGILHGMVVAPRGMRVANTTVSFLNSGQVAARAVSDDDGRFAVRGLRPETYQLSALGPAGGYLGDCVVHAAVATEERVELQVPLVPPHSVLPMAAGAIEAGPADCLSEMCDVCGESPCMMAEYGGMCGDFGYGDYGGGGGGPLALAGALASSGASASIDGGGGGGGCCDNKPPATAFRP